MTENLPAAITAPSLYPETAPSSTATVIAPPPLVYEAPSNWTKDVRGKKCKWVKVLRYDDPVFRVSQDTAAAEVKQALDACRAAIREIDESDECYLMRVEPEMLREHDAAACQTVFTIRARVRWVPDKATAEQCILFEKQFMDESDGW